MKILRVVVNNFRSLSDVDITLDDYTVCVGPNGVGKSTLLHALAWFFGAPGVSAPETNRGREDTVVRVSVTFADIDKIQQEQLTGFVSNDTATFTRTFDAANNQSRYTGVCLTGPGFAEVRGAGAANDVKNAYIRIRKEQLPELEEITLKTTLATVNENLNRWESDPVNAERLVESPVLADQLFGPGRIIDGMIRFILIRGASDLSVEVGSNGRGTTLNELTSSVVSGALQAAKSQWIEEHQGALDDLASRSTIAINQAARANEAAINRNLDRLIPGFTVELRPENVRINVANDTVVRPILSVGDGRSRDVTKEGDGVQRAVAMAMVQAKAEIADSGGGSGISLLLAVEEPELFQHPVRSRAFARALAKLSENNAGQVIIATHSTYFIRADQFEGLRRFELIGDSSSVYAASVSGLAQSIGIQEHKVVTHLTAELPKSFSECFFSRSVVLVEGETDREVLDVLADRMGFAFDTYGVTLWAVNGNAQFKKIYHLLTNLGCPVFLIADGDSKNGTKAGIAELLPHVEPRTKDGSSLGYTLGGPTVVGANMCIWQDDIESILKGWASFDAELAAKGKNLYRYKRAASVACLDDIQKDLMDLLNALRDFVEETSRCEGGKMNQSIGRCSDFGSLMMEDSSADQ